MLSRVISAVLTPHPPWIMADGGLKTLRAGVLEAFRVRICRLWPVRRKNLLRTGSLEISFRPVALADRAETLRLSLEQRFGKTAHPGRACGVGDQSLGGTFHRPGLVVIKVKAGGFPGARLAGTLPHPTQRTACLRNSRHPTGRTDPVGTKRTAALNLPCERPDGVERHKLLKQKQSPASHRGLTCKPRRQDLSRRCWTPRWTHSPRLRRWSLTSRQRSP